jgi:hypothetical protein
VTRAWRSLALCVSVLALAACAGPEPVAVSFRVVTSPGDDPLSGATTLRLVLRQAQADVAVIEGPLAAGVPSLPEVPFGSDYRLRVEARDHDVVLARGSSFPFDVDPGGASISPAVLVGRVVQFAAVPAVPLDTRPDATIAAALATRSGALLVTELGTVYAYRQHPSAAEPLALEVLAHLPSRDGASWCVLPGARLLGVGGAVSGATVLDASGAAIAASVDPALVVHRDGAALLALPGDAPIALALGGAPAQGAAPTTAVTQLELLADGGLVVRPVPSAALATPVAWAGAAAVQVDVGGVDEPRVVLAGGVGVLGASGTAALVDPSGIAPTTEVALGPPLRRSAVVALSSRLVLVAGGTTDDAIPSAALRVLSADATGLTVVTPSPRPLFAARQGAAALRLAEGLVLIVGGTGASGAALSTAELVRVDLETFPGVALATGSLPWPQASPRLVVLGDGTVLSADASGLAFYVSPVDVQ